MDDPDARRAVPPARSPGPRRARLRALTGVVIALGVVALACTLGGPDAPSAGSLSAAVPPTSPPASPLATVVATASPTDDASMVPPETVAPTPGPVPTAVTGGIADVTIPILYYHRAVPIPADIETWTVDRQNEFLRYMLTPCELAAQLDWLDLNGYTTVLPRDVVAAWDRGVALPPKAVVLTFDDGSPDWVSTILPLLVEHGMRAEFYVSTERIGPDITWAGLRALRDAGMGIGGHDVNHVQLAGAGVTTASIAAMRWQVGEAKRILETGLGITVDSMAYVGGGYDATLMQVVADAGYTNARSIERGVLQPITRRFRMRVSRIGVFDDVPGYTIANARACVLDPAMAQFRARVTGTNPG